MESRSWIKAAKDLIEKLEAEAGGSTLPSEEMQKEVTNLFKVLENPTLPSAYRLRDAAQAAGYQVSQQMLQRLAQHEFLA